MVSESLEEMTDRPTPRTDAHARSMPGFADQWVPRYISEELERELAELAALYPRVIAACLRCDPIPACELKEDQLEPPWDVIDRVRRQRDELLEALKRIAPRTGDKWARDACEDAIASRVD